MTSMKEIISKRDKKKEEEKWLTHEIVDLLKKRGQTMLRNGIMCVGYKTKTFERNVSRSNVQKSRQ